MKHELSWHQNLIKLRNDFLINLNLQGLCLENESLTKINLPPTLFVPFKGHCTVSQDAHFVAECVEIMTSVSGKMILKNRNKSLNVFWNLGSFSAHSGLI